MAPENSETEIEAQDSNPFVVDKEDAVLDDLDAQLEDECLESLWAV